MRYEDKGNNENNTTRTLYT